jgi:MSHA biogenesis protein MshI
MSWFHCAKPHNQYAVLSALREGAGALRLEPGVRPRVVGAALSHSAPRSADEWRRLAQSANLGGARLITLLDPAAYQTLVVESPSVPEDELRGALTWKVRDMINIHTDDAMLDYLPIPASEGRVPSLYVVAAQAAAVRQLAQPFQEAELPLEVIRSEERRVGKECRRLCRSRWSPYH